MEYIGRKTETLVLSPPPDKEDRRGQPILPSVPVPFFDTAEAKAARARALKSFNPDLIYLFNFPGWPQITEEVAALCPQAKIVLDIKTPLLKEGAERNAIQAAGQVAAVRLSLIVSLARDSVKSWIPKCKVPQVQYPLGIEVASYKNVDFLQYDERIKEITSFVYVGSLHLHRKIDILIEGFAKFAKIHPGVALHIYGRGSARAEASLRRVIAKNELSEVVFLHGFMDHADLISRLHTFDAGIAWVPREKYDTSPSLKCLEYLAVGLPIVATATQAHCQLVEGGFHIALADDCSEALSDALCRFVASPPSVEDLQSNQKKVRSFDFENIIDHHVMPALRSICHDRPLVSDPALYRSQAMQSELLTIVLVMPSLARGKGGAERVAMDLANEMTRRGHLVYVAYEDRGPPAYLPKPGVILLPFGDLAYFGKQVVEIDPDAFFVFYFNRDVVSFLKLVEKTSIPFGIQECTNPARLVQRNWGDGTVGAAHALFEREAVAAAAAGIRVTMPRYRQSFPDYIRPKVKAFPNPAFVQAELADPAGPKSGRKTVLNINGFKENKNLITLIKAFAHLADSFKDWDLRVIGKAPDGKGPHKREILAYIASHGLENRVLIAGPTDDVFAELAASHIHVIASLSEGCPTVVLEAMAVGVPSIGYADCPGTNELIVHESNGLLARPEPRVEGLAEALSTLMDSASLRDAYGRRALQDSKAFQPKQIYDYWESLFRQIAIAKQNPHDVFDAAMRRNPERFARALEIQRSL